jgi:hypothetical protein
MWMPRRWAELLVLVAVLCAPVAARAQRATVAIAPVTGDRMSADLRSRVAKSLADGVVSAGADVAPSGMAAYVLRGTLEVEGRSYALRLEMLDGKTGSVLATREDRCEICTETEALETWSTAAATLKARVIKRSDVAATPAVETLVPAPGASGASAGLQVDLTASPPPPRRHQVLGWSAVASGAAAIGAGLVWASFDGRRTCEAPSGQACPQEYHNNIYGGGALIGAGVVAIGVGILALLGKL